MYVKINHTYIQDRTHTDNKFEWIVLLFFSVVGFLFLKSYRKFFVVQSVQCAPVGQLTPFDFAARRSLFGQPLSPEIIHFFLLFDLLFFVLYLLHATYIKKG